MVFRVFLLVFLRLLFFVFALTRTPKGKPIHLKANPRTSQSAAVDRTTYVDSRKPQELTLARRRGRLSCYRAREPSVGDWVPLIRLIRGGGLNLGSVLCAVAFDWSLWLDGFLRHTLLGDVLTKPDAIPSCRVTGHTLVCGKLIPPESWL